MKTKKFSKTEAVKFGWEIMKNNFWFFVGILITIGLINSIPDITKKFTKEESIISIVRIVVYILQIIVGMGLIKICLNFCDNKEPRFSNLFSQYPLFFKMFFGSILYGLIVFLGTMFFIIPGIIFGIKFWFYEYLIVDKSSGPIEALKRSSQITKGNIWNLFLFFLLLFGINLIGVLALIVGLFFTIPTTLVAIAFVYRKLLNEVKLSQPSSV